MPGVAGKFLTFIDVESPIDMEEKLFKVKISQQGKLLVEPPLPQKFPGQVWHWVEIESNPLKFMIARTEKKKKEREAQNAR